MLLIKDSIINFLSFVFGLAVLTIIESVWDWLTPVLVNERVEYTATMIGFFIGLMVYPSTTMLLILAYDAKGKLDNARLQTSRSAFWAGFANAVLVTGVISIVVVIISALPGETLSTGFMEKHARYIIIAGLAYLSLSLIERKKWTSVQA